MDEETRAAFGRMDRYFELSQAQHQELRTEMHAGFAEVRTDIAEIRTDMAEVRSEIKEVRGELNALKAEFRSFRDWATTQFAALRTAIQQLTLRIERLENRQNDPAR